MNDFLIFAGNHPILAVIFAIIVAAAIVRISIVLPNRILRHWNIRKHGYPPEHCDADGDFIKDSK